MLFLIENSSLISGIYFPNYTEVLKSGSKVVSSGYALDFIAPQNCFLLAIMHNNTEYKEPLRIVINDINVSVQDVQISPYNQETFLPLFLKDGDHLKIGIRAIYYKIFGLSN